MDNPGVIFPVKTRLNATRQRCYGNVTLGAVNVTAYIRMCCLGYSDVVFTLLAVLRSLEERGMLMRSQDYIWECKQLTGLMEIYEESLLLDELGGVINHYLKFLLSLNEFYCSNLLTAYSYLRV